MDPFQMVVMIVLIATIGKVVRCTLQSQARHYRGQGYER
jgi:hypothetical protein